MDGTIYSKPTTPAEAASHLASFSGKAHHLISSAVIAQGDQILWRSTDEVHMHVHDLTPRFIEGYVTRNWDEIRHCVGCYQLEAEGVRLFQRIDGDYFTVLGMPLLDVLSYLRSRGTLDG